MAKEIRCSDIGMDCDFVTTADTTEELLGKVVAHARDVHGVTEITPELKLEGLAREVVRRVQELRKQADYDLTDRITVTYKAEGELAVALEAYGSDIADEVLADEIKAVEVPSGDGLLEDQVDGCALTLAVTRNR